MPPCEGRICCEVTETYKPWAQDKGIVSLFHDAYARVGYLGVLLVKNDRIKAVRAARRAAKNADDKECDRSMEDGRELQQRFQHIGVTPAAYFP